jgi:Trypsin
MRGRAALSAIAAVAIAVPVLAITYGQPDGSNHPNVGALVGTFQGQSYPYCSGVLISPTVFLTAAHCNIGASTVSVTFDSAYTANAKLYTGTYYADPEYNFAQSDPHDIAVVVFGKVVRGLAPAELPTAGQLDDLPHDQKFTAVGYGGNQAVNQPGGPVISYFDVRQYAVSTLNAVNPAWLRLSQNPATGNGGTCYGDSGGPNFLGAGDEETDIVAATTITGDALCKATNVAYRTDTDSARRFLRQFVILP